MTLPTYTLRAIADGGTMMDNGLLPAFTRLKITVLYNAPSVLEFEYAIGGENANVLASQLEIALWDETGEIADGRFIIDNANGNVVSKDGVRTRKYVAHSVFNVLNTAIVQPPVYPAAKSKYDGWVLKSKTPGYIVQTAMNASRARGELQGITEDFTTSAPTSGASWTETDIDVTIPWGWNIAQIVTWLNSRGEIDFRMRGRVLQMYNFGVLGTDRTTNNEVIIWAGDSAEEIPEETDTSELYTAVLVKGKNGLAVLVKDDAAIAIYKRRVGVLSDDGITKVTDATRKGTAWLNARKNPVTVRTVKYALTDQSPVPFRNYDCGDLIWVDRGGVLGKEVIQQIDVETSGSDGSGMVTLTLGGRFRGRMAKVIQGQQAIIAGGIVTGGSPPALLPRRDDLYPGQVAQPIVSSNTAYVVGATATPASRVVLSWPILTANEDGEPIDDLDHYEVYWRYDADPVGLYQEPIMTKETSVAIEGLRPGRPATAYVLAVNYKAQRGAASLPVSFTPFVDNVPPNTPSTPTMSSKLGTIRVAWNGLDNVGGAMPDDFRYAEIHVSLNNGFTPDSTTRIGELQGPGAVVFQNPFYATSYYAKVKVYDTTGLSAISAQAGPITVTKVSGVDMTSGSVGYDAIAFKDMDNLVADGSFENSAMDSQRSMPAAWSIINSTAADAFHGTRYARVNGATNPSTFRDMPLTSTIDVRFGDQIWVRLAYRRAVGCNGTLKIVASETDSSGALTFPTVISMTTINGSWVETSVYYTPGATIEKVKFSVQLANDGTTGLQEVDAIEIRRVTGTALIMDAAIKNAKIENLAVDDAKIANMHGGKVIAQTISAEEINVGVLGKNLVPNPSFEESWGWELWWKTVGNAPAASIQEMAGFANSGTKVLVLESGTDISLPGYGAQALSNPFPVKPNTDYRVITTALSTIATAAGFSFGYLIFDATGTQIAAATVPDATNVGLDTTYAEYAGTLTTPALAATCKIYIDWTTSGVSGANAIVDDVALIEIGVGASQLSSTGLKVWDINGSLIIDLSSKITGQTFALYKNEESVASIDQDGRASFSEASISGSLTVEGLTLEEMDYDRPWGVRAYGARTGQSAGSTVEAAFLEVQADLVVGRQYRIFTNAIWVANATFETDTVLRYTKGATPGAAASTPGTGSTLLTQARGAGSLTNTTTIIGAYYAPTGTLGDIYEHRFVLTYKPAGGGTSFLGTTLHPLFLVIEDVGPDRGDVGIDRSGGVVTKKDYTKTYLCDDSATYDSSGNDIGVATANQGYYSGTNGNQRSLISFPTQIATDLTGATVKKIEVYLYFNHWYNNSGGTAVIGTHQYTSPLPASMSMGGNTLEDLIRSSGWPKPGGRWVTLPSSTHADFKSGVARGIILGPGPSNSYLYYGKADGNNQGHQPQLRITYNK